MEFKETINIILPNSDELVCKINTDFDELTVYFTFYIQYNGERVSKIYRNCIEVDKIKNLYKYLGNTIDNQTRLVRIYNLTKNANTGDN